MYSKQDPNSQANTPVLGLTRLSAVPLQRDQYQSNAMDSRVKWESKGRIISITIEVLSVQYGIKVRDKSNGIE